METLYSLLISKKKKKPLSCTVALIAQSVYRLATGSTVQASNPGRGGGRDFPHLSIPALGCTQPSLQYVPGLSLGQSSRGVALTTHPPSNAAVKERIELYFYTPSGPSWPVLRRTSPYCDRFIYKTYHRTV